VLRGWGHLPACWHAGAWLARAPGPCLPRRSSATIYTPVHRPRPSLHPCRTRAYRCQPCNFFLLQASGAPAGAARARAGASAGGGAERPTHVRVCPRRQQAWRPGGARARPAHRPGPRAGEKLLTAQLDAAARGAGDGDPPVLGGAAAFELYDTFGFPLEITAELAAERGVQARGPPRSRLP